MDPEALGARLDRILADPALRRAHVGLAVQVLETGEMLYDRNGEKRFVPASNAKLVTAAAGLALLGSGHRWRTRLVAAGRLSGDRLRGDLWVVGGGDPRLTREEIASWPERLRRVGIRRIDGDLVGDDRIFAPPVWSRGWMWDDLYGGWSTGVSGLQVSPAGVRAKLAPALELGEPASLRIEGPARPPLRLDVRTGAPGSEARLAFVPSPEGGAVRLTGWIPAGPDSVSLFLSPGHPTLHLLSVLRAELEAAGIDVRGRVRRAGEAETPGTEAWSVEIVSDSLGALLPDLLKPSDNQMAESILRTVGLEAGEGADPAGGVEAIRRLLAGWAIEPGSIELTDGSGLSRYDEVTPNALNRILRAMWRRPDFALFEYALPLAGGDGTLEGRMLGTHAYGNARAKTGSLSGVRALSGYVRDGGGRTLAFSLLVNGYEVPGPVAAALEDLVVEQLALYRRDPAAPRPRTDGSEAP
ncbi:MAG: D-alanyl-D-alanine carboxypeptidase/D-alanyl-D-alanine-endopeptidase [Gemmatimonadota bacterium]